MSATNLANNLAMVNLESIQNLTDTNKEYLKVGVQNVKSLSKSLIDDRERIL